MTHTVLRRLFALMLLPLCVVALVACGSSSRGASGPAEPMPTKAELSKRLDWLLDPKVSAAEKADRVQGGVADEQLVDKVLTLYRQEGAKAEVTGIDVQDSRHFVATANVRLWGAVHPQTVPFVLDEGKWRLEREYACAMVELLQMSSRACT